MFMQGFFFEFHQRCRHTVPHIIREEMGIAESTVSASFDYILVLSFTVIRALPSRDEGIEDDMLKYLSNTNINNC